MSVITWLIAGAILGWLGSLLTGKSDRIGCLTNIIVGVIGAVLGGLIGLAVGNSLLLAMIVSIALLGLYGRMFSPQTT